MHIEIKLLSVEIHLLATKTEPELVFIFLTATYSTYLLLELERTWFLFKSYLSFPVLYAHLLF